MVKLPYYLIIVIFTLLLREFMSSASIALVVLASMTLFYKEALSKWVINILCLLIFAFYFISYGKIITPEIGINFLLNVVILKALEIRKYRDEVMLIFGLILLTAAGALFDKTLIYLLFFTASFVTLIQYIFKLNGSPLFKKQNIGTYLAISVFMGILFFVLPRVQNPIPFSLSGANEGEIGYRPDADISQIEKLSENDAKVFWVKINQTLPREELYWRGNTISSTDGWNWKQGNTDQGLIRIENIVLTQKDEYRLFIKSPYLFYLDRPSLLEVNKMTYSADDSYSFPSHYVRGANRYFFQRAAKEMKADPLQDLETNLSPATIASIKQKFQSHDPQGIIQDYQSFIKNEKFSYSWSPGKVRSLEEFFEKKQGFCTHYASSLALILRAKGIPARLISGFQGGRFNSYGEFYEISQNDAHAWVEYFEDGFWRRVDPTSFIAPERIQLDYQEVAKNNFVIPTLSTQTGSSFFSNFKMFLGQWDFEFYQFMDQWDATEQNGILSLFKLKRMYLYLFSLICLIAFTALLFLKTKVSKREQLWEIYLKILHKKGILYRGNFTELEEQIQGSKWENKEVAKMVSDRFQELFYGNQNKEKEIRQLLKRINR